MIGGFRKFREFTKKFQNPADFFRKKFKNLRTPVFSKFSKKMQANNKNWKNGKQKYPEYIAPQAPSSGFRVFSLIVCLFFGARLPHAPFMQFFCLFPIGARLRRARFPFLFLLSLLGARLRRAQFFPFPFYFG